MLEKEQKRVAGESSSEPPNEAPNSQPTTYAPAVIQTIRRFKTVRSKRTYRVYCFEEQDLGIPHRFEKKLKGAVTDNDVATDDEEVAHRVKAGVAALLEAIRVENS